MVMEVVEEEMEETGMWCRDHSYKNHTAGGICAFCLQEKLGKLVSSSFPSSIFPSSSNSSLSSPLSTMDYDNTNNKVVVFSSNSTSLIFHRTGSTSLNCSRRPSGSGGAGFWSFLSLNRVRAFPGARQFRQRSLRERKLYSTEYGDDGDCFSREDDQRKVSRSRSVGRGSRSFSGDFFDRISTGFGDCTLRRVESHREGKTKLKNTPVQAASSAGGGDRVRCGGIFGGFSSSSSSSSSTTNNWSAPPAASAASAVQAARGAGHWRSRSWGWALASPMRVFSKPKRKASANVTPNLNAIPSILAVGG